MTCSWDIYLTTTSSEPKDRDEHTTMSNLGIRVKLL